MKDGGGSELDVFGLRAFWDEEQKENSLEPDSNPAT